jgi:hypothetical protein
MKLSRQLLSSLGSAHAEPVRHLPEVRELDLYDRSKHLTFASEEVSPECAAAALRVAQARAAWHALSDFVASRESSLGEGSTAWQRYQQLPRTQSSDKMVAEVFRILRIVHLSATHPDGRVAVEEGLLQFSCVWNRWALSLSITEVGIGLLSAFVTYLIEAETSPYSLTYVEWMLAQYFTDIVAEIKSFADEDRVLYQFQQRRFFNRHFRYDCDNPRVKLDGDGYLFSINALHDNPVLYPLDFFLVLEERLHIVPVEALRAGRLPLSDRVAFEARTPDGISLPASFRRRFVRERMIVGQPMT